MLVIHLENVYTKVTEEIWLTLLAFNFRAAHDRKSLNTCPQSYFSEAWRSLEYFTFRSIFV